jgi:hypothetical protein
MKYSRIRTAILGATLATVAVGGAIFGSGHATPALASPCGGAPCLWIDAIPGGPVNTTATVGHEFDVDVYADNFAGNIGTLRFTLVYDKALLSADAPKTATLSTSLFVCAGATGALPESDPNADGNPATGDAYIYCDGTPAGVSNGPIARVHFTSLMAGADTLSLINAQIGSNVGLEIMSCAPVIVTPGYCGPATVTFDAPPVLPPPPLPPPDPCHVTHAIEGNLVQCADGRHVHFIGVGSPIAAEAGSGWARTVTNWFLAGKTITLETDVSLTDGTGAVFAYPHVVGTDSADYDMSAVLIYVGMARSTSDGINVAHVGWFNSSESYAKSQCWNMWKAGNPWASESACL